MRQTGLVVLLSVALSGCATGHAADWLRPPAAILNPQLLRFGLEVEQARCVGQSMAAVLNRSQLARVQQRAAALSQGVYDPTRITPRDLRAIGQAMEDDAIPPAIDTAFVTCRVTDGPDEGPAPALTLVDPALFERRPSGAGTPPTLGAPATPGRPEGPVAATDTGVVRATWLNLGAATSGQAIAVDAASILEEGSQRTAWFRMTDPQTGQQTGTNFRLRINCTDRMVTPLARREVDADGIVTGYREYSPDTDPPAVAEAGTVTEIAYLSLCT